MWLAAVVTSVVLFGLRLDLSRLLGLGDGEALFFAYGLHPQPVYLNHPGLIGWLARCFGGAGRARWRRSRPAAATPIARWSISPVILTHRRSF